MPTIAAILFATNAADGFGVRSSLKDTTQRGIGGKVLFDFMRQ
jgi:hypothetical protein